MLKEFFSFNILLTVYFICFAYLYIILMVAVLLNPHRLKTNKMQEAQIKNLDKDHKHSGKNRLTFYLTQY